VAAVVRMAAKRKSIKRIRGFVGLVVLFNLLVSLSFVLVRENVRLAIQ